MDLRVAQERQHLAVGDALRSAAAEPGTAAGLRVAGALGRFRRCPPGGRVPDVLSPCPDVGWDRGAPGDDAVRDVERLPRQAPQLRLLEGVRGFLAARGATDDARPSTRRRSARTRSRAGAPA